MTTLTQLQHDFQQYIDLRDTRMDARVVSTQRASSTERLAVYADAYRLRLLEVLGNDYPALKRCLGQTIFEREACACIAAQPSRHFNVRWYGAALVRHLQASTTAPPWAAELAQFEWSMAEVFDAADDSALTLEDMAAVPPSTWPDMVLMPQPALRCLTLSWNVAALRKAVDHATPLPEPALEPEPVAWLLWRQELIVSYRRLDEIEAQALQCLQAGASFAELCSELTRWYTAEKAAPMAASFLKRWISEQLIASIQPNRG